MKNTRIKVQTNEIALMHCDSSEDARKNLELHVWNFIDFYKEDLIDYQVSYTTFIHPVFGLTLSSLSIVRFKESPKSTT